MHIRDGIGILGLALTLILSATPLAAAGHRVETQTRRTASCTTIDGALQIHAFATDPRMKSAGITISTGPPTVPTDLLGVSNEQPQYGLSSRCHSVAKKVVLSRRGLASSGVVHAGDIQTPNLYCAATRRVLMRLVISYNASQKPVSATIEVLTQPRARSGKTPKSKRIGFVQWSPTRAVTYYSPACTSQYF